MRRLKDSSRAAGFVSRGLLVFVSVAVVAGLAPRS